MDTTTITLQYCSSDVIVSSTLDLLKKYHEEILQLRNTNDTLSKQLEEEKATSESLRQQLTESQNLSCKNIEALNGEIARLTKKAVEDQETHAQDLLEKDKEIERINKETSQKHEEELKRLQETSNQYQKISESRKQDIALLTSSVLKLLTLFAKRLSSNVHTLLESVESQALKTWIEGILDKGVGSEMKGLDSFEEINTIDLLKRNVTFQNSFFSDIATLITWSSNIELRNKISSAFDWDSLKSSYDNLLFALKAVNVLVYYPADYSDDSWLKSAENSVDREKQEQFSALFGTTESIKSNDLIFITSISTENHPGSYIKYYLR